MPAVGQSMLRPRMMGKVFKKFSKKAIKIRILAEILDILLIFNENFSFFWKWTLFCMKFGPKYLEMCIYRGGSAEAPEADEIRKNAGEKLRETDNFKKIFINYAIIFYFQTQIF